MADQTIPADVLEFIAQYIDSIAQLETLLLLRNVPDERWDLGKIAARLYTSEQQIETLLARLVNDGLLVCEGPHYVYRCRSTELEAGVDRLADAYKRQLIPITNLIHAKPRRIREFADAFKIKKD